MQQPVTLIAPIDDLAFLQPYRVEHLQRPSVNLPPHVSICPDFLSTRDLGQVGVNGLTRAVHTREPFWLEFVRTERHPEANILYLIPEPVCDLIALSAEIHHEHSNELGSHQHRAFHLTLGMFESPAILAAADEEFWRLWAAGKRLRGQVDRLELYEKEGDLWRRQGVFNLQGRKRAAEAPDLAA
ncbi:MAG TPA: 2'-5' RNA ligase family protein [Anaerolineales bacterium]|nr:2'-5' RNA ligase family protein [Anaerolineales bacterium]